MKNMNTKHFMMLTLLAVGSFGLQAREARQESNREIRQEGRDFKTQMHHIQDELYNVRHHARDNSKMASSEKLAMIEAEITALDKNPEFRDATMHRAHIETLERETRHARNIVKHHGRNNGDNVRVQKRSGEYGGN